jgi:hypothetical protein
MHRRANTSERNPSSRETCPAGTASRRVPAAERRDPAGAGGGPGMRRNTASPPCPGIRRTGGERPPDRISCRLVLQRRQIPAGVQDGAGMFQRYERLVDILGLAATMTAYENAAVARIVSWSTPEDCAALTRLVRKARRDAFQLGRLNVQAEGGTD